MRNPRKPGSRWVGGLFVVVLLFVCFSFFEGTGVKKCETCYLIGNPQNYCWPHVD